jgi:cell division initiation protein
MKITPLEIRQKAFETHFRGYDKEEVDAFLLSLSQEWERANATIREQQIKLESTQVELSKLREVESSLYKTLKTAEETSNNLIDQANKNAELQMRETQMNADAIINDSRSLAKDMIDEAEASIKDSFELMKEQAKHLEQDFKGLESQRENLMSELRSLANSVLERVERSEKHTIDFDLKLDYSRKVNLKEVLAPINTAYNAIVKSKINPEKSTSKVEVVKPVVAEKPILEETKKAESKPVVEAPTKQEDSGEKSFFDLD